MDCHNRHINNSNIRNHIFLFTGSEQRDTLFEWYSSRYPFHIELLSSLPEFLIKNTQCLYWILTFYLELIWLRMGHVGPHYPVTVGRNRRHIKKIVNVLLKDKTWYQSARFLKIWSPFCQFWIICTHWKLWIASASHNFRWVKIPIE